MPVDGIENHDRDEITHSIDSANRRVSRYKVAKYGFVLLSGAMLYEGLSKVSEQGIDYAIAGLAVAGASGLAAAISGQIQENNQEIVIQNESKLAEL